ncbi:hypothetical protein RN001_003009 [Aquatica leii]|uniref:Retrotransposon gag domain-containing protein n=1 Tax=Aquatica leii TaxID=1421715 RepID=A0AAN7SRG0_9COLE|nr:hypothetical protein RN001_003009 [Aquatica leii]
MEANVISAPASMSFEGNISNNWEKYKHKFLLYLEASEKNAKPDKLKVALLLNLMGDESIDIFNTFQYAENETKDNFEVVLKKFDEYCKPRKNVVFESFNFFSRSQELSEPVDKYVTDLKKLAVPCEFGEQQEMLIRDRLVLGCVDKRVQERLLREPDLQLKKALDYCRASEESRRQAEQIQGSNSTEICEVRRQKTKTAGINGDKKKYQSSDKSKKCKNCGLNHINEVKCPAQGKFCLRCKKRNHFAKMYKKFSKKNRLKKLRKIRNN